MHEPNVVCGLTPAQEKVIAAIAGGATMQAAAEAASIHRNTIAYWRRTSVRFREALCEAQYDKALFIREEAERHVNDVFAAIHAILTSPGASDSARLNAAKYIIEKATTPPPPGPEVIHQVETVHAENVNSPARSPAPAAANPENVNRNAQSRPAPKTGRNEPCPCGSRLKFKRCCLGKTRLASAA